MKNIILLVENSPQRVEVLEGWCPKDFRLVAVPNGNTAIGMLRRATGKGYSGGMLDFDLDAIIENDLKSGLDVAQTMLDYTAREVPVFVHSMNPGGANEAVNVLRGAGYDVTRKPFNEMNKEDLLEWLEDCRH